MKNKKQQLSFAFRISIIVSWLQFTSIFVCGTVTYLLVRSGTIAFRDDDPLDIGRIVVLIISVNNLVGLVVTLSGSRLFLKPVDQLILKIDQLASGSYTARLAFGPVLSSVPFFAAISSSFNKLAEELENTEMLRGDFVNNFSHEFKTPIVSIAGFAKLLRRGNLSDKEKLEYLAIIEAESLHLSDLATHVLELTRVENQAILTDVSAFNLSEQLRSCILMLEDKWTKKSLTFDLDFEEHIISANESLLKQVWSNLLDNAVKFSPDSGTIAVDIREDGEAISVSVTNPGDEISPAQQKRIFQKFYQADSSHSSEGNGIGLAIVKRIVELHHGKVSVHSENGLTTFTVELPKKQ